MPSPATPIALAIVLLPIGAAGFAQSLPDSTQPPVFTTEVVVTAERGEDERQQLSVATSLMTRPAVESVPGNTLAEALESLPGFQMLFATGSGFRPTTVARGFFGGGEAEYVKLLVDGVPLSDAESGLIDWRHLPALAIERIEAVRGPASATYGDGSLGGVVQVFTRAGRGRVRRFAIDAGSFGHRFAAGEFEQPVGVSSVGVLASYAHTNGFRDHSALAEGAVAFTFRRAAGTRQWHARGAVDGSRGEEPGALTFAQLSANREGSDPLFGRDRDSRRRRYISARHSATAARLVYTFSGHAGVRSGDRIRTLLLAPGFGDRAHRDISTRFGDASIETSVTTRFAAIDGDFRSGVDLSRDHVETAYRLDDASARELSRFAGRRGQVAAYTSQSLHLSSRVRVDAGVRWDRIADSGARAASDTAWSPKIGTTLLTGPSDRPVAVFAHASRAFKAATVDQLFDPRPFPDFRGGTLMISNPSLRPQRARSIEGGVRQAAAGYRWELVLYRIRMTDEIDFDPATFAYANIGRSTHDGAEFDAAVRTGTIVSAGISYALTRVFPDSGLDRRQLKNIPRHLARPHLTLTFPRGLTVHARYIRTAGAFADDANQTPLGDRSTLDARISKKFGKTTWKLDLMNLTRDRYEEIGYVLSDFRGGIVPFFYPAPGFAARAAVELAF